MKGANGFLADAIQCKRWMASAAIQGHIEAEYHMAKMLLAGVHVKKSLPEAFRHFIRAASKGHVESMAIAGHMLLNASGTDPDDAEAFKWLSKAAKAGNLRAMCDLGYMYADGKVPSGSKDLHVAMRLAERAGSEQSAYAAKSQRLAGSLEAENNNFDCAYEWFLKAAQSGDKDGMASLGRLMVQRLYKNFVGNSCNLAIKDKLQGSDSLVGYDNLGEENANDYNLISLGEIDKNGKDLRFKEGTINLVKSAEFWLKKAADVGHKGAQKDLGFLYVDGHRIGAKIDIKQSVFYLSTAGLFGMVNIKFFIIFNIF